jgi:hypothetical protein
VNMAESPFIIDVTSENYQQVMKASSRAWL